MFSVPLQTISGSRTACWAALLAWCTLIFVLSDQPHLAIAQGTVDLVLRKIAHVVEFGVLFLLARQVAIVHGAGQRSATSGGALFALAYAVVDEWHQSFVEGRQGAASDVLIDACGIAIAAIAAHAVARPNQGRGRMCEQEAPTPGRRPRA